MTFPHLDNLLSWLAQVLVITTVGAVLPAIHRLRHHRIQLLYCHLVLAACILLPLVQPHHPLISIPQDEPVEATTASQTASASPPAMAKPVQPAMEKPVQRRALPATPASNDVLIVGKRSTPPPALFRIGEGIKRSILWLLSLGAAARVLWLLAGLWQIRRYRMSATPLHPLPETAQAAAALTHATAVVCISSDVRGPVMFGLSSPVVLLPEVFLSLEEEAQCGLVCHELLHVRRWDWPMTIYEELLSVILWFSPAAWLLLGKARLAREQIVDAETVRLTASCDPYIDALLAIARARPALDIAPAPLFLRRRHLTQRVYALLREGRLSAARLAATCVSMSIVLACAAWFTLQAFPLVYQPQVMTASFTGVAVPVPNSRAVARQNIQTSSEPPRAGTATAPASPNRYEVSIAPISNDPHELAVTGLKVAQTPEERGAALALLDRAQQNSDLHIAGTPPFFVRATFRAGGNVSTTGAGEITETWFSGLSWRWTANLGPYSQVRVNSAGRMADENPVSAVPMRVQSLRAAIFWPVRRPDASSRLRSVVTQFEGETVTCLLISGQQDLDLNTQGRSWNEREYCIESNSGLLRIHSEVPGAYTVYGYGNRTQFHGRILPERLTVYMAGAEILDSELSVTDAGSVDANQLTITPQMAANGPPIRLTMGMNLHISARSPNLHVIQPVIVHATVDAAGKVLEEELCSAADPSLAQSALELASQQKLNPAPSTQRELYITVNFIP